jgi:hypothetical protein
VDGYLPDGCTEIDEINKSFDQQTKTFDVEITTVRRADKVCTEQTVPFEKNIPLDVYGLPAGTYTVNVNGVTDTFTFESDNKLAGAGPQSGTRVDWEEARELILSGEVETVTQLHSLEVRLRLEDGREVVTTEPSIDAVLKVVDECGEPCEGMTLATE